MPSTRRTFGRVSTKQWRLTLSKGRRQRLLSGVSFKEIISRISREATLLDCGTERKQKRANYSRAWFTLKVRASTVDLFHNASTGYRAQYYLGKALGAQANTYSVRTLLPLLRTFLKTRKRHRPWTWVHRSLTESGAKIWIHQGLWFRYAKSSDRHLFVARWAENGSSGPPERRRKAFWGGLTPGSEARIDIMGGYLTRGGARLGSTKRTRSRDLNELGYT
jgi:hypothetical protein